MKRLLALLFFFMTAFSSLAWGANTPPPGTNNSSGFYNNNGLWAALIQVTYQGITNVTRPFFNAANELYLITNGMDVDPRYFGASCNAQLLTTTYRTFDGQGVTTTQGSNVICGDGYTFQAGTAGPGYGGDIGKLISIWYGSNPDMGPTTYIASVNTGTNCATLAPGWQAQQTATSGAPAFALLSGYPSDFATPSMAQDDTLAIKNCTRDAAIYHGGFCHIPPNCSVGAGNYASLPIGDPLTIAGGTKLKGEAGGTAYGNMNNPLSSATPLYIQSNGFPEDPLIGIDMANSHNGEMEDIAVQSVVLALLGQYHGETLACIGALTSQFTGNAEDFLTHHVTYNLCPIGKGVPFGWDWPVTFTASIAPNSGNDCGPSATSPGCMTVSSITSNNFINSPNHDFLSQQRSITGTSVPGSTVVTLAVPGGGAGVYGISQSATISSETMTSPAASVVIDGQQWHDQYTSNGIGFNGDTSDFSSFDVTYSGNPDGGAYFGPKQGTQGCGATQIRDRRYEENGGPGAIVFDGCIYSQVLSTEFQYNKGAAVAFLSSNGNPNTNIQLTGNAFLGNDGDGSNDVQILFAGAGTTNIDFDGNQWDLANHSGGSSSKYLFETGTACSGSCDYISMEGGTPSKGYTVAVANWAPGGTPAHYRQASAAVPYIDTTQSILSATSTGGVGIGTTQTTLGLAFDMLSNTTTSNSSFGWPSGTTANRPPCNSGVGRYNTTTKSFEGCAGGTWLTLGANAAVPSEFSGLTLSNDLVTPNTIFDIAAGSASSDDGTTQMALNGATSKTTAAWVAGAGNGCLDSGTVANSTWYYVFLIERTDTGVVDIACDTSITQPTLPSPYTEKRFIGALETTTSANITSFTQYGGNFVWTTPTLDLNVALADTSTHLEALNVPPGVRVVPFGNMAIAGSPGTAVLVFSPLSTPAAATTTNPFIGSPGFSQLEVTSTGGWYNTNLPHVVTNSSSQIALQATASTTTVAENTAGYFVDLTQRVPNAPTVSLSFLTTGTLPTGVSLSRTTTGWYFNSSGNLTAAAPNVGRWDYGTPGSSTLVGLLSEGASTNLALFSRDLTQTSAWTATNMTIADTTTGIDGVANSASTLTATSNNATVCQSITAASHEGEFSLYMERLNGTGTISIANDGSTYATKSITNSWARYFNNQASVTNPDICIQLATSGDSIAVDVAQMEICSGAHCFATTPIVTGATTVARSADVTQEPLVTNAASGSYVLQYEQGATNGGGGFNFGFNTSTYGVGMNNGNLTIAGSANINYSSDYNTVTNVGASWNAPSGVFTTVFNGVSKGTGSALAATSTVATFGGQMTTWLRSFQYWPYALSTTALEGFAPNP